MSVGPSELFNIKDRILDCLLQCSALLCTVSCCGSSTAAYVLLLWLVCYLIVICPEDELQQQLFLFTYGYNNNSNSTDIYISSLTYVV